MKINIKRLCCYFFSDNKFLKVLRKNLEEKPLINILHITHTNILNDNRILKEIRALSEVPNFIVYGIGFLQNKNSARNVKIPNTHKKIISKRLFIREYGHKLPKVLKHFIVGSSMFFSVLNYGFKIRPKIIHCHDSTLIPVAVLLKFLLNCKLVYDAHELGSKVTNISKFNSFIVSRIERMCWPFIDHFISVSPSIINWYCLNYGYKKNTLILNAPLFKDKVCDKKNNNRESKYFHNKFKIPADELVYLYLGNFEFGRGISHILRVFSKPHIKSHVVFMGDGSLKQNIKKFTKRNKKIHIHSPVSHLKVVKYSKSADFGLCLTEHTSLNNFFSLPNKLFEYAFSEIPVITSNFPDMKKIINKYKLGVCTSVDDISILKSLNTIEENKLKVNVKNLHKISWEFQSEILKNTYLKSIVC